MEQLPDGQYEVVVVEAIEGDDDTLRVELVFVSGPSKGNVIALRTASEGLDAVASLGLPGTLTVEGGAPRLRLESR